ncbi:MAG: acetate--CoA ligase family protein [Syntrophaceae bacterium]|nr:acetate--CoA ligase family protein [Syntrophaceae bacterium]
MIDFFFEPVGVAVVGATPEPHTAGFNLITNLTLSYRGPIYPVNPKHDEILGLRCYPRVSNIEGPLDVALILVPAPAVPQVLEDCVAKGARGAIIESSGFAEVGSRGKALQDRCVAIARKGGMRLWGPNCMGFIDTSKGHVFSFVIPEAWKEGMNAGRVSLIVQSGLLAAGFITTLMGNKTLGLAKVCSIGNKCDVEETELLEYLLRDRATKVIGLYLESFMNGRRFIELCHSSPKPIVILKGGKTPLSAEATVSHTASLAGNDQLITGLLRQANLHQAEDFFEMIDMARTLEKDFRLQQPPQGRPRIAILSYSGASGIVTTDHLEKHHLTLARLSPQTQKRLEELSPAWMPVKNPVDYWPAAEKHGPSLAYKHGIKVLHDAPEVDGLIVHLFAGFGIWFLDMKEVMSVIKGSRKPILFWLIGPEKGREPTRLTLEQEGWPTFHEIHRTVRVMASLFAQSRQKERMPGIPSPGLSIDPSLKELIEKADRNQAAVLDEFDSKKWLRALDLKVVDEAIAQDMEEALTKADEIGYPVVLKGRVEGQVHKTEAGLVKLNLCNAGQLRSACQEMLNLKPKPDFFMVQPMLKGDLELIAGVIRDPQFGLAAMLGLGGIWTETYRDVAFRLVPLTQKDVKEMVSDLKGEALFKGYRGSKPVNMGALSDWLMKLGWLAMTYEKIEQIDVNPLLIIDGEPVALDATVMLTQDSKI